MPTTLPTRSLTPTLKAGIIITTLAALTLLTLLLFLFFASNPKYNPLTHYRAHLLSKRQKAQEAELARKREEARTLGLQGPRDTRPLRGGYGNYGNVGWKRETYGDGVPVPVRGEEGLFVVGDGEGEGEEEEMKERVRGGVYDPFERSGEEEGRGRTRERGGDVVK
ncbi:hypothetical protein EG328_000560 [Venturia inaequalis]|uniref:Uncharacterized protein n=1 Tax=Venturia inaequalis TaxID=5025 RepID=A0A8H3Z6P1_VENIN|nr:hypothetical protein EG328_000560 [Venturia inaequalis]